MYETRLRRLAGAATLITGLLAAAPARADESPDAGPTPAAPATQPSSDEEEDTSGLTPEEQAELDKTTAADAAETRPPAPVGGGGGVQSMNPDLALITDVAGAWFSEDGNLQAGGHDPKHDGFTLQQVELSFTHNVDPYFKVDGNIVFSSEGAEVEEAYATTLALPYQLQVRAGQFLTRFGRLNPTHPHTWDFVDQPFAISRVFGSEGERNPGVEVSWITPLDWYVEVVGSVNDAGGEGTGRSFLFEDDMYVVNSPKQLQYTLAVKQFFDLSDNWSLMWGVSGANGPNPSGPDMYSQIVGTDVYLKYRPITFGSTTIVSLQAEWFLRRRDQPGGALTDNNGYAYLFWRFAQRWGTAVRWEYGSAAHDSNGDVAMDPLDPDWTGNRQRASANLTFWPTEFSRLRVQGSADMPSWQDNPTWAFMFAAEFVVGAHGAHKF